MESRNHNAETWDPWASEFDLSDTGKPDLIRQPVFSPPTTLGREYLHTASVFLGVFVILFGTILGQFILTVVLALVGIDYRENATVFFLVSALPMYAFAMPLSLIVFRQSRPLPPAQGRRVTFGAMVCLFCAVFALSQIGSSIGSTVNEVLNHLFGKTSSSPIDTLTENTPFWLNFLLLVIAAPVLEEIFYRKLVIDRLRRYGDFWAVFGSALIFGLVHGNFTQFFYALFGGILFGWVYVYSGRIRYSMILHALFNAIGVVSSEIVRLAGGAEAVLSGSESQPLWLTLFLFALEGLHLVSYVGTVLAGIFLIRKLRPQKSAVALTTKQKWFLLLLNPSLWVLVLILLMLWV